MTPHKRIINDGQAVDDPDAKWVTREQGAQLIAAVKTFMRESGVCQRELARNARVDAATLAMFLQGLYAGAWDYLAMDLDRWLEEQTRDRVAGKPLDYVETGVSREIALAVRMVIEDKGIGLLRGDSGVGKSTELMRIVSETPMASYVCVARANLRLKGFLEDIGQSTGRLAGGWTQAETYRRVIEAVRFRSLLVIDEVHKLCRNDDAFEVLRDIFDATGVPQIWSGTTDLIRYFQKRISQGRQPLSQIRRRIIVARNLSDISFTATEIRRLLAGGKKLDAEAAKYMVVLANLRDEGGLGLVKALYRTACRVADKAASGIITRDMLWAAHGFLGSQNTRQLVLDGLKNPRQEPVEQGADEKRRTA